MEEKNGVGVKSAKYVRRRQTPIFKSGLRAPLSINPERSTELTPKSYPRASDRVVDGLIFLPFSDNSPTIRNALLIKKSFTRFRPLTIIGVISTSLFLSNTA